MVTEKLDRLKEKAKGTPKIREELLLTRSSSDPMEAFCKIAKKYGFDISIGEIITEGEEYSCNQLKSTNGGGVNPYDYFDDPFEMFFMGL